MKQTPLDTAWELKGANPLEDRTSSTMQGHDRLVPPSLITLSEKPLATNMAAGSLVEAEGLGELPPELDSAMQRGPETGNQLDFISPEAQMIADQILRECESSSGSVFSESTTDPVDHELEAVNELEAHTPSKHQHTQTEPVQSCMEGQASPTAGLRPKSAESDVQLSARSIFVDLSLTSLQAESSSENGD